MSEKGVGGKGTGEKEEKRHLLFFLRGETCRREIERGNGGKTVIVIDHLVRGRCGCSWGKVKRIMG